MKLVQAEALLRQMTVTASSTASRS